MQVETIQMDPRVARVHYADYLKKVREHREERRKNLEAPRSDLTAEELAGKRTALEKEDEELKLAYRALSKGERLLNLGRVLGNAGVDGAKLPRLAIARADWEHCYFRSERSESNFASKQWTYRCKKNESIKVSSAVFPAEVWNVSWRLQNNLSQYPVKALVPSIPAYLRPAGKLSEYHILWEAEWTAAAPVDPILLKQVNATMFAVLAQWDLTPLEQQVLEGRLS